MKQLGKLQIMVLSEVTSYPVQGADVSLSITGAPTHFLKKLRTDESGKTREIELFAPLKKYSLDPNTEQQPYAEYTIYVEAEGYEPASVAGIEILPGVTSLQKVHLHPKNEEYHPDINVISGHTLYEKYPPKMMEDEIQPMEETGEIVLHHVVVPEYIIVHDGPPKDDTAKNYYVPYMDYIKNVACSEIYATWPENTIRANVLAIMSFTLNRVYTEHYRNKGYDFTITSSTVYDQKWIHERNIFDTISDAVEDLVGKYLSRPGVKQPILTQYCDGRYVQCPNGMSQWGSMSLGEQGYSTMEILRYYYGNDIYINTAPDMEGIPSSWPGYTLEIGSRGEKVKHVQEELNRIADAYPAIPEIEADGIYGKRTAETVRVFQNVFRLPETGKVDFRTWFKISQIYVGVSKMIG